MVTVMVRYVGEVYYTFSDSFSSLYEEVKYCGKSIELHIFGLTPSLILVMAARNGFLAFWGCYKAMQCGKIYKTQEFDCKYSGFNLIELNKKKEE